MATITTLSNPTSAGTQPSRSLRAMPYVVENFIDFAAATTAKGSALAANDVIEALQIPAQSAVLAAGFEVMTTATGDVTLSLGVTGVTAAAYVSAQAITGSTTVGTFATAATAGYPIVTGPADTLDVLIAGSTTAISAGKIRVFAVLVDVIDHPNAVTAKHDQLS
jgi:hypothetical protein